MTGCSASLVVKETLRQYDATSRPQLGSLITLSVGENVAPGNTHMVGLNQCNHVGKQLAFSCTVEFSHTPKPQPLHASVYTQQKLTQVHQVTHTRMSTTALSKITCKSRKIHPQTGIADKQLQCFHTMKYYTEEKMNERELHATTRMNPRNRIKQVKKASLRDDILYMPFSQSSKPNQNTTKPYTVYGYMNM